MATSIDLHIEGMTCAACSSRIERALNKLPGVSAHVSLIEHRAHIEGISVDDAIAAIRRAGYDAWPSDPTRSLRPADAQTTSRLEQFRQVITVVALVPMLFEMAVMLGGQHGFVPVDLQFVLATLMQTVVAWPFYKSAWRALRAGSANMETLVSLGTLAAYGWSVFSMLQAGNDPHPPMLYFEASVVVLAMVRLGKTLEAKARAKALEALESLIRLDNSPVDAWQPGPGPRSGSWQRVAPESVAIGTRIRVHPHEPVSLDGEILSGQTEIDESAMTGESLPAVRGPGQRVFAGSLNLSGMIEIACNAEFSNSRRAQIGSRILEALSTRAPIAALADRVAAVFVPLVLVLALLTAFAHIWLLHGTAAAIQNAVAVLVVACPCALGLATPAAIAAGLARSAQHGWLFRSADALQRAASIDHVVFDKTGTLTSGRPQLVGLRSATAAKSPEAATEMGSWPDWLAAAAAAERGIEHPLAGALLSYAAGRPMPEVVSVENQPGSGVLATVSTATAMAANVSMGAAHTQQVMVGKPAWIAAQLAGNTAGAPPALGNDFEDASAIDVAIDQQWAGRLWVADSLRPDAEPTLIALKEKGYACTILSGDRVSAVRRASKLLNDTPFFAEKTPEQKSQHLEELKSRGDRVAMVGDGLNDAAAMAHAHLGIAMAAGASLTLQTADLTLSNASQLMSVSQSLALSKAVMRRVKENLAFAFGFNLLALPLAAMGHLSPVIAGTAMALSSAAVMLNAIRLLGWKP